MTNPTYPVVGVGVDVVHPKIPRIEQEVVGVGVLVGVSDAVGVGQPIPRRLSQVGEAEGDWLVGVSDGVEQPYRPRSPVQEGVGAGVAESLG